MNYKTIFKTGSWALILTAAIHSLSLINEHPAANDTERQLLDLMNNYKMDLGAGFQRSMDNLMTFFSLSMSVFTLAIGILNLLLTRFFDNRALAGKLIGFNALLWTFYLIPLYLLTFLPPLVCYAVAALLFLTAWSMLRKTAP
jgi:hypothetical protein